LNARGKQSSAQDESYWDSSRLQRIVTSFEMHDGQDARRSTGAIAGGGEKQKACRRNKNLTSLKL
jgi:hypothetical protein